MIRISAGSAARMGLIRLKTDVLPTTAYLLHGEGCLMNCAFCAQARGSAGRNGRLGRVTWPAFSNEAMLSGLKRGAGAGLRRVCLQGVRAAGGLGPLPELLKETGKAGLPLSISTRVESEIEVAALFRAGAERVSIALDAANPSLYSRIKGGSLKERLGLLLRCARRWPGRMVTHIICGLGETEEQVLSLCAALLRERVTPALFAFTPLQGTPLEGRPPPDPGSYRRLQAAHYLLRRELLSFDDLEFAGGKLVSFGFAGARLKQYLRDGEAFRTAGCPGCNRPYYNERPGGVIYNYPRPLTPEETETILAALFA